MSDCTENKKKMLTVDEAAEKISFSRRALYRAIAAGDLHLFKYGKIARIRVEDLDEFTKRY